ncbi:MAG: phosphate acyltransferase PlsX [Oscillospiraceae bacterium]
MIKLVVDAFGGDDAPLEVIKGCKLALEEYDDIEIVLTGSEDEIKKCAKDNNISLDKMTIVNANSVIPVTEDPTKILKEYRDSSMAVGMELVAKGEGDAFISAGSTGAIVVGGSLIVKRLKGIKRAAIGTVLPCKNGHYMLMDAGGNSDCRPEMLVQFAVMSSAYMMGVLGKENPKVALVNIGAEETKGLDLQVEAYKLLKKAPVNFIGNIEARYIPLGGCDIAVCDGFTGNVILKLTEGLAKYLGGEIKTMLLSSLKTKIGALFIKNGFNEFKSKLDYKEMGGAPLLGLTKPVIKAHGSSDARAFKNAIRQARLCVMGDVPQKIATSLADIKAKAESSQQLTEEN